MNFNDIAIVSIKENDYRIHFWCMSKVDTTNTKNSSFNKKKWINIFFFTLYKNE